MATGAIVSRQHAYPDSPSALPQFPGFGTSRRRLSLEQKLPLLMTGVLLIVLATSLALTYQAIAQSAEASASTRLARVAGQLASSIEGSINQRAALQRRVASDSAVHRVLRESPRTAADGPQPNERSDTAFQLVCQIDINARARVSLFHNVTL